MKYVIKTNNITQVTLLTNVTRYVVMNISNKYYSNEGQVINITIRVFPHEQEVRLG